MRLALSLGIFLAAAASRQGCGSGPSSYDPCAARACGDPCTLCAPGDPGCAETAIAKACDPSGRCVAGTPACAPGDAPCAGKACGAECVIDPPCRGSDPPCMAPSVLGHCDSAGVCLPGEVPPPDLCPPPPWSCAGKACGDPCGVCPPGTDPAQCPVPTFAATACDARGECVTAGTFTCSPADACRGKVCGAPCDLCGGACMHPYATACDYGGWCAPETPWLCYDPCAGKACGDACQRCPPDATGCSETTELKACGPDGRCDSGSPTLVCP